MDMPISAGPLGTVTLILTPKLINRFGATSHLAKLLGVKDLYGEAIKKSFQPVTRSRSVPDFEERFNKAVINYSKHYDAILYEYVAVLGPSRFKIEYVKQITEISKELRDLPFASLDLSELFRQHVACCTNAAGSYEELFENDSAKLYEIDHLSRTSNYGLTLLVLLLDGTVAGPLWIMGEVKRLTSHALGQLESMPEIHATSGQLSGSLVIAEGSLDVTPSTGKPR